MLEFAWPLMLYALPLPLIAAWLLPRARASASGALRLPHGAISLPTSVQVGRVAPWKRWLALLAWTLLIGAACRPQWLGEPEDVPRSGRDLLLAVDTSGSMSIEDMQIGNQSVPRFNAIQAIVSDFIRRREGDRVGLILFGSQAYLQVPLTFDLRTVAQQLREASIGLAGRETAIGDAVGLAVKRLRERPADKRVLILLTDGVNTAGVLQPDKATELAKASNVRIYTVGVGADSMRVDSLFGSRMVNPSQDLDEPMLTRMAEATGGQYFRARDSAELANIYRQIDSLEPSVGEGTPLRPINELYWIPLALALLLAMLGMLAPSLRRRSREAFAT